MRYEFWKDRCRQLDVGTVHTRVKVYNVALYSTWEAK